MNAEPRGYWPPLVAGVALGLVLYATFMVTGHGLGASGFFARLAAATAGVVAPEAAADNAYLGLYLKGNPLAGWITWEVLGVIAGGLIGSLVGRRFRPGIEKGRGVSSPRRLTGAFAGGALVGVGSRLARGCTSGLGLSGGATLAVAGFVFLIAFFVVGFATMRLVRRDWS